MIYLGFAWADYDPRRPLSMLCYQGVLFEAARAAVIAEQEPTWTPPTEATSYRRGDRSSATTSDSFAVGSVPELDPDEIIVVPARAGELENYYNGEVWAIDENGDINVSFLDLADHTVETPTWTWSPFAAAADG